MIGQTVSHYRIVEKLGEGGMGSVYAAEDTHLGRRVAIKFPHGAAADERRYRARFLREARAVSGLNHPHIATLYDYGETVDGQPFIVMELVEGETLSHLLINGKLTLARAAEIVRDVAEALGEAHRHGIVHRDVKPSNVIINERAQVKVLDFGLVKHLAEERSQDVDKDARTLLAAHTQSGMVVGTPLYLSPEQARGAPVDARSDIFALGAVLYECLTGRPAFSGATVVEIAAQVMLGDPKPPSEINSKIPPELERITLKALAKKPEMRYQSAAELIADLEAVRDSLKELGHAPATQVARAHGTSRVSALATFSDIFQRPRLPIGIFLLVLLAVGLAIWGIVYALKPTAHKPSAEAEHWYEAGTNALRDGTYFKASKAFDLAIKADEKFALAHARLAEAWGELDYADKAKDELLRVSYLVPDRSVLPQRDALYLQAITATVSRDFKSAVMSYQEVVRQSTDQEKPYAYVDLGRAFEKNEEVDKAIESYAEAARRDPQYATAFLRVGVLYGRKQDQPNASAAFDKAEALYQALSNYEGVAEIFYQRGTLLLQVGKMKEARAQYQRSLDLARTTNNKYQEIRTLLQLSYVSYAEGDMPQAQQYARQAADEAQANEMENLTARALVDLGNTYFVSGDYAEAEKYFKQSLELSQRFKVHFNEARALVMLGSLRYQQGDADGATKYASSALAIFQQGGWRKETSQALIVLGRALRLKGDYDTALGAFQQQLQLSQQVGDQSQAAAAYSSIATTLVFREQYPEALRNFDESYKINQSLNAKFNLEYDLVNRGGVLWQLGDYQAARAALEQAFNAASRPESSYKAQLPIIHLSYARMALSERNFKEARARAKQALDLAGNQQGVSIEAKYTLGLASALSGAKPEGKQLCDEAVDAATRESDPRLLSGAQLALAQVLLETGETQGALETALRAQESFARTGQQDSEWRAWLVAATASRSAGDRAKAQEYGARAATVLLDIKQKWGDEAFNNYLKRPDVQYSRKQLDEMLALKE
ncbi:MAG: eukaryotic-like serine/threonine-protein kinase [Acidobacteriota bacterium]|jgi:tetratricopeptide (TPR) repeat protein/tRNA A-37 threonylcarbamoyl transferase component Bud32|nr:eukaryotic-like serine/threonine-protein kinase [Acidobacteriota bacterium]